jgi:aspartate aminotransferase
MPDGAFYAFPCGKDALRDDFNTSEKLATFLLARTHIAVTPGEAFGTPGYLRLSYATSLVNLQRAVKRIGEGAVNKVNEQFPGLTTNV